MKLLNIENLQIEFNSSRGNTLAVKGIDFSIAPAQKIAIVGESGSGKSVTAMSITKLLPEEPICKVSGKIEFQGQDINAMTSSQLRAIRGKELAYIFQEPSTSLNPVFSIGWQIAEAIKLHFPEEKNVKQLVIKALEEVGIDNAHLRYDSYPHELSGGMQQRVMIAMALSCKPKLLIADEPTTALDVSIQKQIIDLLKTVCEARNMALMLITHNFGIIADFCDKVIVMFRGEIVEEGNVNDVLYNPKHPYTKALIDCIPQLGNKNKILKPIDYAKL